MVAFPVLTLCIVGILTVLPPTAKAYDRWHYLCDDEPTDEPYPEPAPSSPPHFQSPPPPPAYAPTGSEPSSSSSSGNDSDEAAGIALEGAHAALVQLIQEEPELVPEFLRLGFHDSIGGVDGCLDLSDTANNGLAPALVKLDPIVEEFAYDDGVTRADIWALSAFVAVEIGNHVECRNNDGDQVPCSATQGPGRNMPSANLNSRGIFEFFAEEFGFSKREAVAAMGGHNVGQMHRNHSGIDGPHGWVPDKDAFVNAYYRGLIGYAPDGVRGEELGQYSFPWERFFMDNSGLTENSTGVELPIPSTHYWTIENDGKTIALLNADVALVRELDDSNLDPTTGRVSCAYRSGLGAPPCPLASTIDIAAEFMNNDAWLNEFRSVLEKMTTNGYELPAATCPTSACRLIPKYSVQI